MVNDTGEIRFTLYTDSTSDLLSANMLNIIIGASIVLMIAIVSASIWFWMRARRRKRSAGVKGGL
jgi:hypothetical protein